MRAVAPCVYAHIARVLRAQEQLGVVVAMLYLPVVECSVRVVRSAHGVYQSIPKYILYTYIYIYDMQCISPFVALTISLIVYVTEDASALVVQC